MTLLHSQNRIAQLKKNPIENAKLIKKWERLERKYKLKKPCDVCGQEYSINEMVAPRFDLFGRPDLPSDWMTCVDCAIQ